MLVFSRSRIGNVDNKGVCVLALAWQTGMVRAHVRQQSLTPAEHYHNDQQSKGLDRQWAKEIESRITRGGPPVNR